jgi:hypothetical protein
MAYLVIENFITKEEQKELLNIVETNKNTMFSFDYFNDKEIVKDINDKVAKLTLKSNLPITVEKHNYLLPIENKLNDNTTIQFIIKKLETVIKVPIVNSNTVFGWGFTYLYQGASVAPHYDPIKNKKQNQIIIRMNIIVQPALDGGNFMLYNNDGFLTEELILPELSLMIFPASEVLHSISVNKKESPRINFSIDTIVDKKVWDDFYIIK